MSGNRKVAAGGAGDDRLSDVTDGILEHVLSFLPAADSVRSSVLSRRCCPMLKKLRLTKVSGGLVADGGLRVWPLVLHLDMLEELVVDRVESFRKLQVVSANLRVLGVHSCFDSLSQWRIDTVVEISAPRLEVVGWSGFLPKDISFLNGSHCIRRLSGLLFYLPGNEVQSASAAQLLEICSSAIHLSVCIDIPNFTTTSMLTQEKLDHVPQLPNIRVLSLQLVAILRFINCPIAPIIFSFLRRCPNLTRLHIDLSMLHQFSRLDPEYLLVPDNDVTEVKNLWQSSDCNPWKACRDQLELGSLREIRISGFMGTDCEMEVADVLFGVGAARPALERISIILPQVRQCMDGSPMCGLGATSPAFKSMSMPFHNCCDIWIPLERR